MHALNYSAGFIQTDYTRPNRYGLLWSKAVALWVALECTKVTGASSNKPVEYGLNDRVLQQPTEEI